MSWSKGCLRAIIGPFVMASQCKATGPMRTFFFLLLSLALAQPASARLYKWVDEQGNVHYS
ncbi:MAG TPA: DUF4124 domain-containing protein, partial [Sedimenticola sp.]|nr:DUF4124 domain-containing protein [Sedimenticola sp.]